MLNFYYYLLRFKKVINFKIISLIGYSGSGKTQFISEAIKLLKKKKKYHVAVIKNIHEHKIDKEEKDTYKYGEAGAVFSITKNISDETTIFIKKEIELCELMNWIVNSPFEIDLIFIEGFRNLDYPTILCIKSWEEFEPQFTDKVVMVSGIICSKNGNESERIKLEIPIINIQNEFEKFLEIFELD
jgi:molybdopterin-guanine dinucleotide biosynthesis protein B